MQVKIADFGLAKVLTDYEQCGTFCGTYCTMAPEIVRGYKQYYGSKVDIWSLGCIFFQLVTGLPLVTAQSPESLDRQFDFVADKVQNDTGLSE